MTHPNRSKQRQTKRNNHNNCCHYSSWCKHFLQLIKRSHQETSARYWNDISQRVKDRENRQTLMEEQRKRPQKRQQNPNYKAHQKTSHTCWPTERCSFTQLKQKRVLLVTSCALCFCFTCGMMPLLSSSGESLPLNTCFSLSIAGSKIKTNKLLCL